MLIISLGLNARKFRTRPGFLTERQMLYPHTRLPGKPRDLGLEQSLQP